MEGGKKEMYKSLSQRSIHWEEGSSSIWQRRTLNNSLAASCSAYNRSRVAEFLSKEFRIFFQLIDS